MTAPAATPLLAVVAVRAADVSRADALARALALPQLTAGSDPRRVSDVPVLLLVDGATLALQQTGARAPGPVCVDFSAGRFTHRRRAGGSELLGRAVGAGGAAPRVLDAAAGLGRDAFVLATLGCDVMLCEREPVLACLLRAGMVAAAGEAELAAIVARMQLVEGDARRLPPTAVAAVEVVYLDPMFPERRASAAVKKELALLQQLLADRDLVGGERDAEDLLDWALAQDVARVVVKRPLAAAPLAGRSPSHTLRGRSIRYDVHVRRALRV